MGPRKLNLVEKSILRLVVLILGIGFYTFYNNLQAFEKYIQEDGIVEWLTVLGLLLGMLVCIMRFTTLRKHKGWWFLFVTIGLAFLLFVAAGEEISWGQRILGIKSSEFFEQNNAQKETNFHNLVVNGVKINKLVFSIGLISVMGIYLLVFPLLYRYSQKFKEIADNSGIPIPRLYQVISILVLFLLTELLRHEKRAELLEAGITLLFFLIIRYPANQKVFERKANPLT